MYVDIFLYMHTIYVLSNIYVYIMNTYIMQMKIYIYVYYRQKYTWVHIHAIYAVTRQSDHVYMYT